MRRRLAHAVTVAAVAAAAGVAMLLGGGMATAANPPIGISDDGVTYGSAFPGQLFDGVVLVPGTSATRSFWVKNTGPSDANLAIAVRDVSSANSEWLAALTMTAHVRSSTGSVGLDDVNPCVSLVRGVPLDMGDDVRVDITLTMANVGGTTAQGAIAAFNIAANLTSDDVPAPSGCADIIVPPSPTPNPSPTPGEPGSGDGGTVVVPGFPTDPADPGEPTGAPTPQPTPSPTGAPSPSPEPGDPDPAGVVGNTDRFHQEWFVALWVAGFVLGGALAWRIMRQRDMEGAQR